MAYDPVVKKSELMTEAEYLAFERAALEKHEFVAGRIYAMAGATRQHNLITGNVAGELRSQLKGKPCETYSNDMRVRIPRSGRFTYPDVVVVCGAPQFLDDEFDTLLNPLLIVEVLSRTTGKYDLIEKFSDYRSIESFAEYLLIAQDSRALNHFVKRNAIWTIQEVDERVELTTIACTLSLDEIYERVQFDEEQPENKPEQAADGKSDERR
jgi:Uma2 family endonuclease